MISVITPTIREDAFDITKKAVFAQDDANFELLVCSPFDPGDPRIVWIRDDFKGGAWTLNRAYAALIDAAKGDIIVSWQDSIWAPPDTLARLTEHVRVTGAFVSAVGDQYERLDEYGIPAGKIWDDPRKTAKYGTFYEINFDDVEYNLCAFPKKAIKDIGGIDTELDFLGFGMDMYQVSDRADDKGYRFYIDQSIESRTLRHGRERKDWDERHLIHGGYEKRKKELKRLGKWC